MNNLKINEDTAKLKIGNLKLNSVVIAAPMAGITDTIMRQLIRLYSKDCLVMSEMISSEALKFSKEQKIISYNKIEQPLSFQLSGHKPELMAEAAKKLELISQVIDINMACPIHKIVKNFDGCRLMTDLNLASSIISAVKKAVNIPVTVKCRLGWDHNSINVVEFAKMAEDSGADGLIVHGRTKSQLYSGKANWEAIGEVKQAVNIPVIANGDIDSPENAAKCLQISGCDGIAIGRAIIGDPGLIARIERFLYFNEIIDKPDIKEIIEIALLHCKKEIEFMNSEEHAIKFMRKFFAYYISGIRNAVLYRTELIKCSTFAEVERVSEKILNQN